MGSLKLIHYIICWLFSIIQFLTFDFTAPQNETMTDEAIQGHYGKDNVMAHVKRISDGKVIEYKLSDFPVSEKLEKFMEDVK